MILKTLVETPGFFYALSMKSKIISFIAISFLSVPASAMFYLPLESFLAADHDWRFGAQLGQVSLLNGAAQGDENSFGWGGTAGVFLNKKLVLEADYLSSRHNSVDHSHLAFGANYYLGEYDWGLPNLSAGISFISNEFGNIGASGDGIGPYIGGGVDLAIRQNLSVGLQLRYQKISEGKTTINGVDYTTTGDIASAVLRVMLVFGGEE
jgi:hypothetical protein